MNLLFRWCFLVLLAFSLFACEKDDDDNIPSTTNPPTNNNGGSNSGDSFIAGDIDGLNGNYPILSYSFAIEDFVQAIALDTTVRPLVGLSIAFRPTLALGKHNLKDGNTSNALVLVTIADTSRNGGQFISGGIPVDNFNNTIEFTKLDTLSGEVEGSFNARTYQWDNGTPIDSVTVINGRFKFDYK